MQSIDSASDSELPPSPPLGRRMLTSPTTVTFEDGNNAFMDPKARYLNDLYEKNFESYLNTLKEIKRQIFNEQEIFQLRTFPKDVKNLIDISENDINVDIRQSVPNSMVLGGSALAILSDFFQKMPDKFTPYSIDAPRTNDFDVTFCVNEINEINKRKLLEIVTNVLSDVSGPFKNVWKTLTTFPDIHYYPESRRETILRFLPHWRHQPTLNKIFCNKLVQISSLETDTYYNMRVNIFHKGEKAHLFELVLWTNNFDCGYKNLLSINNICIPSLYDLTLNYFRVIYRRGFKSVPKSRQDTGRYTWLINLIEKLKLHYPTIVNELITDEEFSHINKMKDLIYNHMQGFLNGSDSLNVLNIRRDLFYHDLKTNDVLKKEIYLKFLDLENDDVEDLSQHRYQNKPETSKYYPFKLENDQDYKNIDFSVKNGNYNDFIAGLEPRIRVPRCGIKLKEHMEIQLESPDTLSPDEIETFRNHIQLFNELTNMDSHYIKYKKYKLKYMKLKNKLNL